MGTKLEATRVHNLMVAKAKKEMILRRHFVAGVDADNVNNKPSFVCWSCDVVLVVLLLEDTENYLFTNRRALNRTPSVNLTILLGYCTKVCGANK